MTLQQALILAVLVETIVNILVSVYVHDVSLPWYERIKWKIVLSIFIGEIIAFTFGADMTRALTLPLPIVPQVGVALTGLVVSRGSNLVHDIVVFVNGLKNNQQLMSAIKQDTIDENKQM